MSIRLLRLSPDGTRAIMSHGDSDADQLYHYRGLGSDIVTYSSCEYGSHSEWLYYGQQFDGFPQFDAWREDFVASVQALDDWLNGRG